MSVPKAQLIGVQPVDEAAYDAIVELGEKGVDAEPAAPAKAAPKRKADAEQPVAVRRSRRAK